MFFSLRLFADHFMLSGGQINQIFGMMCGAVINSCCCSCAAAFSRLPKNAKIIFSREKDCKWGSDNNYAIPTDELFPTLRAQILGGVNNNQYQPAETSPTHYFTTLLRAINTKKYSSNMVSQSLCLTSTPYLV